MNSTFLEYFKYYHLGEAAYLDLPLYLSVFLLGYDSYPVHTAGTRWSLQVPSN